MASSRQGDLFQADARSGVLDADTPTPEYRADPDSVRAELYKILAEARAAQKLPWEPRTILLYRTIFPQMTNWLPDEEGAQLRFEFETEIRRLEAA
jgi:hypothetical protein